MTYSAKLLFCLATTVIAACSTGGDSPPEPTHTITVSSPKVISVSASGTAVLTFDSNAPWSISLNDTRALPSWIDANPKNGGAGNANVTISITQPNPTTTPRTAYIKLQAGTATETITVIQGAADPALSLDKSDIDVRAAAGSFSVSVTSNSSWTTSGVPSWITLTPSSGSSGGSITVNYTANTGVEDRTATITFTPLTGTPATLVINQRFSQLDDLDPENL